MGSLTEETLTEVSGHYSGASLWAKMVCAVLGLDSGPVAPRAGGLHVEDLDFAVVEEVSNNTALEVVVLSAVVVVAVPLLCLCCCMAVPEMCSPRYTLGAETTKAQLPPPQRAAEAQQAAAADTCRPSSSLLSQYRRACPDDLISQGGGGFGAKQRRQGRLQR